MPISPERRGRYPSDWKALATSVKEAAGWCCVQCGVAHSAVGAWDRFGIWLDEDAIHHLNSDEGLRRYGDWPNKMVRVVLTVHHRDFDPANNERSNLASMCQRCHLIADGPLHQQHAAETRRRKRLERTGQTVLEGIE